MMKQYYENEKVQDTETKSNTKTEISVAVVVGLQGFTPKVPFVLEVPETHERYEDMVRYDESYKENPANGYGGWNENRWLDLYPGLAAGGSLNVTSITFHKVNEDDWKSRVSKFQNDIEKLWKDHQVSHRNVIDDYLTHYESMDAKSKTDSEVGGAI